MPAAIGAWLGTQDAKDRPADPIRNHRDHEQVRYDAIFVGSRQTMARRSQANGPDESDDNTIVPQLQWLWVTKELGDSHNHSETFVELSQMVSTTGGGDSHLRLKPYEAGDADALTQDTLEGYDAEKNIIFLLTGEHPRENHRKTKLTFQSPRPDQGCA